MAEVLKYGFISTPSLLNTSATYQNVDWDEVVRTCVMAKAEVVQADEFETLGLRASLNFGHTIGHAIEKILRYKTLLHGEAISIGMVVEAKLGEAIGVTPRGTAKEVERVLALHSLPTTYALAEKAAELIQAMRNDKKRKSDNLAFSLLIDIGQCKLFEEIHPSEVEKILEFV